MAKKQLSIVGTERETIEEIEEVAAKYVAILYERMELQKQEPGLLAQLEERMKAHKQSKYVYFDEDENRFEITLSRKTKLAVKRVRPQGATDEGDDE